MSSITPENFPAHWVNLVNEGKTEEITKLYNKKAVFMPTFSPHSVIGQEGAKRYFTQLSSREGLNVMLYDTTVEVIDTEDDTYVITGVYIFGFKVDGIALMFPSRFTFSVDMKKESPILHHHSSQIPRTLD